MSETVVEERDIVERLRTWKGNPLCLEAAREIEKLRNELNEIGGAVLDGMDLAEVGRIVVRALGNEWRKGS